MRQHPSQARGIVVQHAAQGIAQALRYAPAAARQPAGYVVTNAPVVPGPPQS